MCFPDANFLFNLLLFFKVVPFVLICLCFLCFVNVHLLPDFAHFVWKPLPVCLNLSLVWQGPDYRLYKSEPELTTVAEVDENNGEDRSEHPSDREYAGNKGAL